MDEQDEGQEMMAEMEKQRRTREQTSLEISDIVSKWDFLTNTIIQKVGNNEAAKQLASRMLASALIEKLAEVVAKELDIDFTIFNEKD